MPLANFGLSNGDDGPGPVSNILRSLLVALRGVLGGGAISLRCSIDLIDFNIDLLIRCNGYFVFVVGKCYHDPVICSS